MRRECWFAALPNAGPCDGRLVRCHLLPRQIIKRESVGERRVDGTAASLNDPRCWVWGCGGPMGPGGHHGRFKPDGPWPIPRSWLPPALEEFAAELGLSWWLDRTYGVLRTGFAYAEDRHTVTVDGAAGAEEYNRRGPLFPPLPPSTREL